MPRRGCKRPTDATAVPFPTGRYAFKTSSEKQDDVRQKDCGSMLNPARIPSLIDGHLDNSYFGSMVAAPKRKEARPTDAAAQMGRGEARN